MIDSLIPVLDSDPDSSESSANYDLAHEVIMIKAGTSVAANLDALMTPITASSIKACNSRQCNFGDAKSTPSSMFEGRTVS